MTGLPDPLVMVARGGTALALALALGWGLKWAGGGIVRQVGLWYMRHTRDRGREPLTAGDHEASPGQVGCVILMVWSLVTICVLIVFWIGGMVVTWLMDAMGWGVGA